MSWNQGKGTVILASASPRRTELLDQAGISHQVIPSRCEEILISEVPEEVVKSLALQKAEDVFARYEKEHTGEDFLVIGSDTVVAAEGKILGKPKDEADAFQMLSMLQDRTHQVYTGVALLSMKNGDKKEEVFRVCSEVQVYPMDEEEIRAYIATGEPADKAGAYGIQGKFAIHIKGIVGDYNNIVGLPIGEIYQRLKKM